MARIVKKQYDTKIDIEWIRKDICETTKNSSEKIRKFSKMFRNNNNLFINKESRNATISAIGKNLKTDSRHQSPTQISKPVLKDVQLSQQLSFTSIGSLNNDQIGVGSNPITIFQLNTFLQTPKTFNELLRNSLFKVRL